MDQFPVVAIGEILWDLLPTGPVFGGAPANFASHAGALGAQAVVISRVGDDELGRKIREQLRNRGLSDGRIQTDPLRPTSTVSVRLENGQPHYTIHENVAWDHLEDTASVLDLAQNASAICFGSLAQRSPVSRQAIQRVVAASDPTALRVFDINLRQYFYDRPTIEASLRLANVLKLNDAELPILADLFSLTGNDGEVIAQFAEQFSLKAVVLTRGAHGSLLAVDGELSTHSGLSAQVNDTVGAGDAFTAAFTIGLLRGWPLDKINEHANQIAAYVCSQSGATPALPPHLIRPFLEEPSHA